LAWPKDRALTVPLVSGTKGAWLLAQPNQPLEVTRQGDATRIVLPATPIDATDTVVVLQLEGEPKARPLASAGATAEASVSEANIPAAQDLDRSLSRRRMAPAGTTEATLTQTLDQPIRPDPVAFILGVIGSTQHAREHTLLIADDFSGMVHEFFTG
jgi:hypothetical protein